ncbi:hypothetical protein Bbelb_207650 [Branchiostoma belcheri]|nr:hypothetical protein Bbelb_207650 [Branchiostoma belcheri]
MDRVHQGKGKLSLPSLRSHLEKVGRGNTFVERHAEVQSTTTLRLKQRPWGHVAERNLRPTGNTASDHDPQTTRPYAANCLETSVPLGALVHIKSRLIQERLKPVRGPTLLIINSDSSESDELTYRRDKPHRKGQGTRARSHRNVGHERRVNSGSRVDRPQALLFFRKCACKQDSAICPKIRIGEDDLPGFDLITQFSINGGRPLPGVRKVKGSSDFQTAYRLTRQSDALSVEGIDTGKDNKWQDVVARHQARDGRS